MKDFFDTWKFRILVAVAVFLVGIMAYAGANGRLTAAPQELLGVAREISPPLRHFLEKNTDPAVLKAFMGTAQRIWPASRRQTIARDNMLILVPAFTITELTRAFQIGFLLYLPFVAIDLIISNILLAMGMMMVSPMTISLPFKLLLFVTLDGWLKISQGLLLSYQ